VLDGKVSTCEGDRVDQLQHGSVDHWAHRLHVIESKPGIDSA
jgi:hypothetical protein